MRPESVGLLLRSIPGFLDVRYRLGDLSVDVNCAQDIGGLAIHLKYAF